MPNVKIVTEVAGRVCALPETIGGTVSGGADVAFIQAMKMETPVVSPATSRLKSIVVSLDQVVAEEQVVAILQI